MSLIEKDRKLIWHPFTQEKTAKSPMLITKGNGSYLYDDKNNKYLDLVSSWWVNIHGHAHPVISDAIYEQCKTMEHVIFAGFTHPPAIQLCELFSTILPSSLTKYFFTDNGSTATEVALKMAIQYWKNKGQEKKQILCFEGAYHGDTFGAMSVGVKSGFHDAFKSFLFPVLAIPYPHTWIGDNEIEAKEEKAISTLKKYINEHLNDISAIIVEPLIQGASGMKMCRPSFIQKVVELVRKYNILVIFDEVMTGFGRTGTLFAFEQIGVVPDFLCLSKGITGGFLPLALTVTKQQIYEAFLGDSFETALAHGHSYTANAIGCAAAVASLKLLLNAKTKNSIRNINKVHNQELKNLLKCRSVKRGRIRGTVVAFDVENIDVMEFKEKCAQKGILIRPLGNTFYLLPPYCITENELENAYKIMIDNLY